MNINFCADIINNIFKRIESKKFISCFKKHRLWLIKNIAFSFLKFEHCFADDSIIFPHHLLWLFVSIKMLKIIVNFNCFFFFPFCMKKIQNVCNFLNFVIWLHYLILLVYKTRLLLKFFILLVRFIWTPYAFYFRAIKTWFNLI